MELSVAEKYKKGDYVKWSKRKDENHCNAYKDLMACASGLTQLLENPNVHISANFKSVLFKVKMPASELFNEYSCLWFEEPTETDLAKYATP